MTAFFIKLTAAIMSFFMAIASFLGINIKKPEPADTTVKNVIIMIGDGMGSNHLEKTKNERGVSLTMDTLPLQGYSMTRNIFHVTTDSAAGGTALSCGIKTYNGSIGLYSSEVGNLNLYDPSAYPLSITELCRDNGMKTGIITTDSTDGATPAAFSAHTYDRSNSENISRQQIASGFDLIWGLASSTVSEAAVAEAGYTYIDTLSDMNNLNSSEKSFGQFTDTLYRTTQASADTPTLSMMTEKAISQLNTSEDGFFLMVEGAHIDKNSHNNNGDEMEEALIEFDNSVKVALDFAKADGDTLVVVTADHETGGITKADDGSYYFTKTSHSSANVPLRAYGYDSFIGDGEAIENKEVPAKIAYALGFTSEQFPIAVIPD